MSALPALFVITGLGAGGAETMLLRLLRRLDRQRFAPHVISLTGRGELAAQIEALGVPVEALDIGKRRNVIAGSWLLARRIGALRPAIVHTWMYHADLLGGAAARLAGVRAVVWAVHHSNLSPQLNKARTLRVVRACAALSRWLPARIVCCSEATREVHRAIGYAADKLEFIPNGFELDLFRPQPAAREALCGELNVAPHTPFVGMVGRFDPQKNHAGFFRAARLIHARSPDVHFVLAGHGIDARNAAVQAWIDASGLGKVTHLLGRRDDMPQLMPAFDVLVSSSHGEAFPNVLGEAMACEVPCVVTDVGDCARIVGDGGRVVAPGDMESLAQATLELLALGPAERAALGRYARERVRALYSIEEVARQYEALYQNLMHDKVMRCAA